MKKFAFVSRHAPTEEQVRLAAKAGINLNHVGDRDGFTVDPSEFSGAGFSGVIVVHAAGGIRCLAVGLAVGVFENVNRAPAGQPPQFGCGRLVVYAVADADADTGTSFPLTVREFLP